MCGQLAEKRVCRIVLNGERCCDGEDWTGDEACADGRELLLKRRLHPQKMSEDSAVS